MEISVIFPVYNESENLHQLHDETKEVMNQHFESWEAIYVEDGSADNSYHVLLELQKKDKHVKLIKFRRNFGQSAALLAGFDHAKGDIIITMDADLQNDPKDIPRLVEKLKEGYDCVSGWRKDRKDPVGKRFPSWIQTKLAMKTGPSIHDFGCTLKAYRADAIESINLYGEGHRYIPSQLYKNGYKITELTVNHRPRTHGKTKYGSTRIFKGLLDLIFNYFWNRFSVRPIHFLGSFGILFMSIGFLIGFYWLLMRLIFSVPILPHLVQLLFALGLFLFGFLLLMFGILAEILIKIYYQDRKPYSIEETKK